MDELAKFLMIFFAGYEIFKLFNIKRMTRVIGLLNQLSEKNKKPELQETPELFLITQSIRVELGWMFYLEFIYPFAMILILFSRYFYVGAGILLFSFLSFIILRKLPNSALRQKSQVVILVLGTLFSMALLLLPLIYVK